jgi:hypothetical protein
VSWPGIFLVRVPEGTSPRAAVDATIVGWIPNPNLPRSHIMAVRDPVEIEAAPEWPARCREILFNVNPNLSFVGDSGVLDDGVGPVTIHIYSNEIQLMPKRNWLEPDDMDGFAVMWDYCVALAVHADCVAHDPDDYELINLGLDLRTARRIYNWL